MACWTAEPTQHPSPETKKEAVPERFGYVAATNHGRCDRPDELCVVDLVPQSSQYGQIVSRMVLPYVGDELHRFDWNSCRAGACPYSSQPHLERRYLIISGLRSSRLYIADTKPNPWEPQIVKIIEPD